MLRVSNKKPIFSLLCLSGKTRTCKNLSITHKFIIGTKSCRSHTPELQYEVHDDNVCIQYTYKRRVQELGRTKYGCAISLWVHRLTTRRGQPHI